MSNIPSVTIITPTVGTKDLQLNLDSVVKQDYTGEIQHLVVFDGTSRRLYYEPSHFDFNSDRHTVIQLPFNTGSNGFNGHRIYGAFTFLAQSDWLIFLDEDNTLEPNHVSSLVELVLEKDLKWAYSLRNIVDENHKFVCRDDCESLGKWKSCIGDHLIDVNCFFMHKQIALELGKFWYRRARHPEDQPEVDRLFTHILLNQPNIPVETTGKYTVNYKTGNTKNSVRAEFFLNGNSLMKKWYPEGPLPWSKE